MSQLQWKLPMSINQIKSLCSKYAGKSRHHRRHGTPKVLTLSGGQQQRVSIARALCCETELIVADEPTGNLDERTSKEVVTLFQDLAHKEGKCVIMVTHDPEIAKVSDVKLTLKNGSFVEKKQSTNSLINS